MKSLGEKSKTNQALNAMLNPLISGGDYSFYFLGANASSFAADGDFGNISKQTTENIIKVANNTKRIPTLYQCTIDFDNFIAAYRANNFQKANISLNQALNTMKTILQTIATKSNYSKYDEIVKMANQFIALAQSPSEMVEANKETVQAVKLCFEALKIWYNKYTIPAMMNDFTLIIAKNSAVNNFDILTLPALLSAATGLASVKNLTGISKEEQNVWMKDVFPKAGILIQAANKQLNYAKNRQEAYTR